MTPDPYRILEISKNATQRDIKLAFYKLSKKWHPDKNQGGTEKFREIVWAYKLLSNETAKSQYDQGLYHQNTTSSFQPGGQFFNWTDIEEMFRDFENIENMGQATRIDIFLPVTIKELYKGAVKDWTIQRRTTCPTCQGLSRFRHCEICKGLKTVIREKTFSIEIKKGTLFGQKMKFIGEGDDIPGSLPGNVYFTVTRKDPDNQDWDLDGSNLIRYINIDLRDCFGNSSVSFQSLNDNRILYKTVLGNPPKAKHVRTKKKVRPHTRRHLFIQNLGMPNQVGEGCGSLLVKLKPNFPTQLPSEIQKKIKKLKGIKLKKIKLSKDAEICQLEDLKAPAKDDSFFKKQFKNKTEGIILKDFKNMTKKSKQRHNLRKNYAQTRSQQESNHLANYRIKNQGFFTSLCFGRSTND